MATSEADLPFSLARVTRLYVLEDVLERFSRVNLTKIFKEDGGLLFPFFEEVVPILEVPVKNGLS
jgi:hypothetical protein